MRYITDYRSQSMENVQSHSRPFFQSAVQDHAKLISRCLLLGTRTYISGASSSYLVLKLSHKACFGSKPTILLPRHVL